MKNSWARAKVLEASDRSYSGAVLPLLDQAREAIVISFYLIEPDDQASADHPVNRLLEALLRARQRGVRVKIYLNTNFRFRPKTEVGAGKYFERLLEAGVELTTLLPRQRLHDKLIVIDTRYVVEGSMNWSVSALVSNRESVSVIDSPAHAQKKLQRIEPLALPPPPPRTPKRNLEPDRAFLPVPEKVEIPVALFEKNRLPRMLRESDARTMDLYLTLLGQAAAWGKPEFDLDLETAGRLLQFSSQASSRKEDRFQRARLRRQVIKGLRKLAGRYQLLEVEFPYARDAQVRLQEFPGERVEVPGRLLDPDYLAKESSGSVLLALVREILKKEGVEIDSLSAPEIEKRFGIGKSTILRTRIQKGPGPF